MPFGSGEGDEYAQTKQKFGVGRGKKKKTKKKTEASHWVQGLLPSPFRAQAQLSEPHTERLANPSLL